MKYEKLIAWLLITIIIISCDVNSPEVFETDKTIEKYGLVFQLNHGTVERPGELFITNTTNETIYLPYVKSVFCEFSLFIVKEKLNSNWVYLTKKKDEWFYNKDRDSVYAICEEYKNPLKLLPFAVHYERLTGFNRVGNYKIGFVLGFSKNTPGEVPEFFDLDYVVR